MDKNLRASLIKDIEPGNDSSSPNLLGIANGNLIFSTSDFPNSTSTELWKTDGTEAGTVLIEDLGGGSFPGGISSAVTVEGAVFFFLNIDSTISLRKTDGTESGTTGPLDSADRRSPSDIANLTSFNNTAFYTGFEGSTLSKLFKIDNDTNERIQIKDEIFIRGGDPDLNNLTPVNDTLFFQAPDKNIFQEPADYELWKTDGTDAGTILVKDINETDSSNPFNLTDISGTLFFTADNGTNGRELWKSNGTEAGTKLVKDINPGQASLNLSKLTDVNGVAYFVADNGTNGTELWKSDGTESGTVLVKDIIPESGGSNPNNLTNVNGTLFFTVNDGSNGTELWKSDGTDSGTALVKDINSGENSSNPANLKNLDGILYFTADDGSNGVELWKSDGTPDGTVLVEDINPGSASSSPSDLTVFEGELYFNADDGVNGRELWGLTEGGTDLILGGDSNDLLLGNEQDNIIDGLKGDDTLTGGFGKDKFVLSEDFGSDVITDFKLGEDEIINATDRIVLTVATIGDAVNVAFSNTGDVLQVNLNGNEQGELENYLLNIGSNQALPY